MLVRGSTAQQSVLIQPCDLRLIITENVDNIECAAVKLVNITCLGLDLLDCEDILLCGSGSNDLVFFQLSGCTWPCCRCRDAEW